MSRQDEKKLYEQQEEKILAQSDAFISLLTKRGILADQKIDSEKVRSAKQEKTRNSYHNTLMLLQQYRTIVWMMECFPETIAEELEKPFEGVDALIEHMDVEMAMGNRKLENRMDGIQKSRLLLDRVNEALTVLKKKPENGGSLWERNKADGSHPGRPPCLIPFLRKPAASWAGAAHPSCRAGPSCAGAAGALRPVGAGSRGPSASPGRWSACGDIW